MMRFAKLFLIGVGSLVTGAQAATVASSSFDASNEGWSITDSLIGTPTVTAPYSATSGNPDGNIFIENNNPQINRASFSAPSAYLGNWAAQGVTSITYDISVSSAFSRDQVLLLVVRNANTYIGYYAPTPATGSFLPYEIPTTSNADWRYACNSVADCGTVSVADFQAVMADVRGLHVVGDFEGSTYTTRLDNVSLSAVPAPGTLVLLGTALAAPLVRRLRRS